MTLHKAIEDVRIKSTDRGEVQAVVATLDTVDSDGDVMARGSFGRQDVVISAYGHSSWDGHLPVGKGVVYEAGDEAVFDGRFFMETAAGRDTFSIVRQLGGLQEWSFSLHDIKGRRDQRDGKSVRIIDAVRVKEVSPVLLGSGVRTRTLAVKRAAPIDRTEMAAIRDNLTAKMAIEAAQETLLRSQLRDIRWNVAQLELGYSAVEQQFTEAADDQVRDDVRKAAEATLSLCMSLLRLPARPRLRFYLPETDQEKAHRDRYGHPDVPGFIAGANTIGLADRAEHTVWLRADLTLRQAMTTTAHEARHLQQRPHAGVDSYVANEHDARDFAQQFTDAYLNVN